MLVKSRVYFNLHKNKMRFSNSIIPIDVHDNNYKLSKTYKSNVLITTHETRELFFTIFTIGPYTQQGFTLWSHLPKYWLVIPGLFRILLFLVFYRLLF